MADQPFTPTDDEKRAFAAALLKHPPTKIFEAALSVWPKPDQLALALWASTILVNSDEIKVLQHTLRTENPEEFLPTKEEAARAVWEWTQDGNKPPTKERIESMRLFCELRNFIEKPVISKSIIAAIPPKIVFSRAEPQSTKH